LRDGLATAILYRKDRSPLIGHTALEEYGEATPQERAGYTLRTHFKPDIANGQEARKNATDFLAATLKEAHHQRLDIDPQARQVIFGVPSEAAGEFRDALAQVAREAGYGEITMLDEPKGALFYHLFHKDIRVCDAQRGLLVIDFGGGTCDFAFLYRGNVRHSWGDMRLGGRLFDDLFFQWFLDENPGALEAIRKDSNEFFVHLCLCREIKEFFSRTMTRDRTEKVTKAVRQYGRIRDMTWEGFLQRARSYSPSATFKRFLEDIGHSGPITQADNGPVDLITWFRSCLTEGFGEIDKTDIRFVALAGGSSQWPFVPDIVQEELGVKVERIMRSDRPYAAISEGLSIWPAYQTQLRATQQKLRQELPQFVSDELMPLLDGRAKVVAKEITGAVTQELFDKRIKPILLEFRSQGGSIASLKQRIASAAASFEPRLRSLVEDKFSIFAKGLPVAVRELMVKWLDQHGLLPPEERIVVEKGEVPDIIDLEIFEFYEEIADTIAKIGASIAAVIVAMICGGGGMALIMSGPIGWLIGLIMGAIIMHRVFKHGLDEAKQMAEDWNIPALILGTTLSDGQIAKTRKKMVAHIESAINGELSKKREGLKKQIQDMINRVIDGLNEINNMA